MDQKNTEAAQTLTIAAGVIPLLVKTPTRAEADNCEGTDSIRVNLKRLHKRILRSYSLTPNRDGANDLFKPMLFGNVRAIPVNHL